MKQGIIIAYIPTDKEKALKTEHRNFLAQDSRLRFFDKEKALKTEHRNSTIATVENKLLIHKEKALKTEHRNNTIPPSLSGL